MADIVWLPNTACARTLGERWGRGGSRCVFKRFWVEADSVKAAFSRSTDQRVPTGCFANASRWVVTVPSRTL